MTKEQSKRETPNQADPVTEAHSAGLRYVHDSRPGIRRVRRGKGFRYLTPDGKTVRDEETLSRIRSLVIPPAWKDVWICSQPNGHLQATGHDVRGRKQYRYHPRWRAKRDETKYGRLIAFAQALPRIRARVESDLARPGLPRSKVLATVVRLLETTLIRVGNEEYARANGSFGLTTFHNRHVTVEGTTVHFAFRGKSGVRHEIDVCDPRLARIVRRCQELPGHELFEYADEKGETHAIGSADVNGYLHEIAGEEFTAKDFRTWEGTVLAMRALREFEPFGTQRQAKSNILAAIKSTAQRLGNTAAVCRKCYIHPGVLAAYLNGTLPRSIRRKVKEEPDSVLLDLNADEKAALKYLKEQPHSAVP